MTKPCAKAATFCAVRRPSNLNILYMHLMFCSISAKFRGEKLFVKFAKSIYFCRVLSTTSLSLSILITKTIFVPEYPRVFN